MRSPQRIPWIIGGAADLAPSTKTRLTFEFAGDFQAGGTHGDYRGRNMHFGIREHAMCAAVNGMTLTCLRAFGSGFLIFTDYARGAIRLASLMDLPVLHIWTHDSISVGEDGPTHEPIEQLVSLRAIPGMVVIRPADANEMTEAYRCILQLQHRPVALICSRQALPIVDRTQFAAGRGPGERRLCAGRCAGRQAGRDPYWQRQRSHAVPRGARPAGCRRRQAACRQHAVLGAVRGAGRAYRDSVLPPSVTARVTVEEASPIGWQRYAGAAGVVWACAPSACRHR